MPGGLLTSLSHIGSAPFVRPLTAESSGRALGRIPCVTAAAEGWLRTLSATSPRMSPQSSFGCGAGALSGRCQRWWLPELSRNRLLPKQSCRAWEEAAVPRCLLILSGLSPRGGDSGGAAFHLSELNPAAKARPQIPFFRPPCLCPHVPTPWPLCIPPMQAGDSGTERGERVQK